MFCNTVIGANNLLPFTATRLRHRGHARLSWKSAVCRCTATPPTLPAPYKASYRTCSVCHTSKANSDFPREPCEPFRYQRLCSACLEEQNVLGEKRKEAQASDVVSRNMARVERLQASYIAADAQARFRNMMSELDDAAASAKSSVAAKSAARCRDPIFLEKRMDNLELLLGLTRSSTIQLVRDQPAVVLLEADILAQRLIELKTVVPQANIMRLVHLGPWLLLLDNIEEHVRPALRQMDKMMPGFKVASKLDEGSGVWWSFADFMRSVPQRRSYG